LPGICISSGRENLPGSPSGKVLEVPCVDATAKAASTRDKSLDVRAITPVGPKQKGMSSPVTSQRDLKV